MIYLAWTLLMGGMVIASLAVAYVEDAPDSPAPDGSYGLPALLINPYFLLGMGMILLGIIVNRWHSSSQAKTNSAKHSSLGKIQQNLQSIIADLGKIKDQRSSIELKEFPAQIENIQENAIFEIVESREAIIATLGYGPYGTIMSDFATGERFIARSWSAGVDGYDDEAFDYVEKSLPFFENAAKNLTDLSA
ncbi:MAG: hypothetical protein JXD22_09975 [Sedimentisphaerales bacterium]|nr:hypothetical protein [Sedimentisphaerales bacterium]